MKFNRIEMQKSLMNFHAGIEGVHRGAGDERLEEGRSRRNHRRVYRLIKADGSVETFSTQFSKHFSGRKSVKTNRVPRGKQFTVRGPKTEWQIKTNIFPQGR